MEPLEQKLISVRIKPQLKEELKEDSAKFNQILL